MKFKDINGLNDAQMENGIIESVTLSIADHGCLTAWIGIKFDCGGCSFGGFHLGKAEGSNLSEKNYAAEWIVRCLNVLGRERWESLPGTPLRCLHGGLGHIIYAIGNHLKDDWFCPRIEFKAKI